MASHIKDTKQIGLIFGKFYPLHQGHLYLIEKALAQVDELHVMLGCEKARDQKLFEQSNLSHKPEIKDRFYWLKKSFKDRPNIHIHILDEANIAAYPNGWKDWSDRVKAILDQHKIHPTVIFTSDSQDVDNHQLYFQCSVKLIDASREFMNISATQIRQAPYENWSFIANSAKPFFVKKIAIIGDDYHFSDIALQLANIYNTQYVGNGYINYINQERNINSIRAILDESAFVKIAMLHAQRIDESLKLANKVLFSQFDFKTLHYFYQKSFGKNNPLFDELNANYPFDLVIDQNEFSPNLPQVSIFAEILQLVDKQLK